MICTGWFGLSWWLNSKELACQCQTCWLDLWVTKITPEEETATHSSIFAWEIPCQRSLACCSPSGLKRGGRDLEAKQQHEVSKIPSFISHLYGPTKWMILISNQFQINLELFFVVVFHVILIILLLILKQMTILEKKKSLQK